ncbi:MAG: UDP-N-acetylmuramoyl-tripeptide--D-alanyl-D-alanine ligase [Deltaproteobacteria bacterium]|nr:UDP-N-acetylmuramoyl-tripeptide--D-alanyl-D-alanine ligase [Deltaproteobacteria bacterium]
MTARFTLAEAALASAARIERTGTRAIDGVFTDSRKPSPGAAFVALQGDNFDGSTFAVQAVRDGASAVIVHAHKARAIAGLLDEAKLDASVLAVSDTTRALLGLARAHRGRMGGLKTVAITGSAGKTSTKELVASVLSAGGKTLKTEGNLNNEIGVPLTLLQLESDHAFAAVECGMNHLGELARLAAACDPDVGIVTNVGPVHLEGCGSIEGVAHAKGELFHALRSTGVAVANADDARVLAQGKLSGRKLMTFGAAAGSTVRLVAAQHAGPGLEVKLEIDGALRTAELQLLGLHNGLNACAAAAAGLALDLSLEAILHGLSLARTPGRRMRPVLLPNGGLLIDDCYNANPASVRAALLTIATLLRSNGRAILVLGDMLELGPTELDLHRETGAVAASISPALLVCFGPRARSLGEGAIAAGMPAASVLFTEVPDDAVRMVQEHARQSDVILVKGSRGMRMERISDPLSGAAAQGAH